MRNQDSEVLIQNKVKQILLILDDSKIKYSTRILVCYHLFFQLHIVNGRYFLTFILGPKVLMNI